MKVIKFRGKRPDGSWNYGRNIRFKQNGEVFILGASVVPQTVGKFIGLHDSEGKDIYEGDVIVGPYGHLHVIRYNASAASYTATLLDENLHDDLLKIECHVTQEWIDGTGRRVAGNVFDTPEYLKV